MFPQTSLSPGQLLSMVHTSFPSLKGGQQEPHHCGYGNVYIGGPTEQPPLSAAKEVSWKLTLLFTKLSSNFVVARTTPQHGSYQFSQSERRTTGAASLWLR
ncbi:hypothetical protein AMECASPLE_039286 [Ameca splendens]|uniref:Uncharacterized protein n=1 Tax=Ameca splendens TaxID=208324 RepID=A0ABV1A5E0_9TELE